MSIIATSMPAETAPPEHLYELMAQRIGRLIDQGTLRPGDRVPSVRKFSRQH